MHESELSSFVLASDHYMNILCILSVCGGVLILLFHEFRVLQIKDYKQKYDYVNLHEIRFFWYAILAFIIAAAFYFNTIASERIITHGMIWFYVRVFIVVSFVVIAYIVVYSMIRIYYPRYVEKRLVKLRNTPRVSPDGNLMRKLNEEEEDSHLDAAQIAEEANNVHSVDYDVWIDEKTGFKKIEKYDSYLHAEQCPECGYYTLKITKEELETKPTHTEPGLLLKHYSCSYCDHREIREVRISQLSQNK